MLDSLRGKLWEHGVHVPSVWNATPAQPSQMQLVWPLRKNDLADVRDQMREILTLRPQHVVISCEALSRLEPHQIVQFRHLLGSAPAQVVYYVRRWPEHLASLWQETVKFTHTTPFLVEQMTRYDRSELRDTVMIDRFAAVFGATQVNVVPSSQLVALNAG